MAESCTHNCETCGANCSSRQQDFGEPQNTLSEVKKVIAVMSGKGGVGKSLVTSMLAVDMARKGYRSAVLDADITGPSIPKAFGIKSKAVADESGIYPAISKTGVEVMSINLLLPDDSDPVIWRGPILAGTVKQFWAEVVWGDVDYMFVDMPPGTGDVPLTVLQSLPVAGIVFVTTPQELVSMIVSKAVKMAKLMNIPIVALVENMSYFECPGCNKKHFIFGQSELEKLAAQYDIENSARLPIDPKLAAATDAGLIELFEQPALDGIADAIEKL